MSDSGKPYIITIVGPESSGKTTLVDSLADFLGCPVVPEYARTYLNNLPRTYSMDDLVHIARGQMDALIREVAAAGSNYEPEDSHAILLQEDSPFSEAIKKNSILFFSKRPFWEKDRKVVIEDSGLLSIRLWAEIKYGTSVELVEKGLAADETDMYVLCRPVYPWQADPLRESRSLLERVWIYNHFLKYLIKWSLRSIAK